MQRRNKLADLVRDALKGEMSPELKEAFQLWLDHMQDGEKSKEYGGKIEELLEAELFEKKSPVSPFSSRS